MKHRSVYTTFVVQRTTMLFMTHITSYDLGNETNLMHNILSIFRQFYL